jgi:hypothetical protein
MKISITLVHNKTDEENITQIEALASFLTMVQDFHDQYDEEGNIVGQYSTYHQELTGLDIPHEIRVYQVIPFGVTPPPNRYSINTGGIVEFGQGDNDKIDNHPRFFNWGLKRGIDQGADISVFLIDPSQLTANKIKQGINALKNDVELIDLPWVKLITKRALRVIGQLKEDGSLNEELIEYKDRMIRGGLKNG